MATFTNTQRGAKKLVHEGFTYNRIRTASNGRMYWRCDESKLGCKGTAISVPGEGVRGGLKHNHPPLEVRVTYKRLKSEVKKAAATDMKSKSRDIIMTAMEKVNPDVELSADVQKTVQRLINRKRKVLLGYNNPSSSDQVKLPQKLCSFMLEDTGESDPNRIIILGSSTDLDRLMQCQVWAVNSAFSSDKCWYRLWVIYGVYKDVTLPLLYCLLLSKDHDSCERALELILKKNEESKATPTVVIFDFDKTTECAFRKLIPGIKLHGCFYSFAQNVGKKIKELDLMDSYENDDYIKIVLKSFAALAFVPLEYVRLTFETLVEELITNTNDDAAFHPFINYFTSTWIGQRKPKTTPAFPIDMWNHSDVSMEGLPRSTNPTETWRHAFFSIFYNYHTSIYKLIEELSKQQAKVHSVCERLDEGMCVELFTTSEFKYANENLFAIITNYDKDDIGNFLQKCSNYIDYKD